MEREILLKIVELANLGHKISFTADLGGNTLTVYIDDMHSHCGSPDEGFDFLINDLYDLLVRNKGLSFA